MRIGRAPTLRILLADRNHVTLQAPGLSPLVEGDHVDSHLLGDRSHAQASGMPLPPPDIRLDGLATTMHQSSPSGPLMNEVVGMERDLLSWQKGLKLLTEMRGNR